MSRIAIAYLNIPLEQLEDFGPVKAVFAHNTKAIVDSALLHARVDKETLERADALKIAADNIVAAYGTPERFEQAKADFVAAVNDLRNALTKSQISQVSPNRPRSKRWAIPQPGDECSLQKAFPC